jgi:GNAT superfamily N-acetyltransferase
VIDARHYRATDRLRDGRPVWLRAIRPSDRDALREGLHHLSPESAYYRFFRPKTDLTESELDYFTKVDFVNHVALVAIVEDAGQRVAVGTARYIVEHPETSRDSAEIAFVVDDAHQGLGIGAVLLRHLARIARESALPSLHASVLGSNRSMLSVFAKSGLPLKTRFADGVVEVTLSLAEAGGA